MAQADPPEEYSKKEFFAQKWRKLTL